MDSSAGPDAEDRTRIRQQEVVAELGQRVLETDDLDRLLRDGATAVADTLDVEYVAVLESHPGDDEAVLRQGAGWSEDLVGTATVPVDRESEPGTALRSDDPVIVVDRPAEERFSSAELLAGRDVASGVSARIGPSEGPWGVLGAHATEGREFTEDDGVFVQNVANVLASAIENDRAQSQLDEVYGRISDAFFALDEAWRFTHLNERAHELINPEGETLKGEHVWDQFPDAVERQFKSAYERAMYEQETVSFEEYYPEPLDAWFEVRVYPSETGLSVYFRDVTEPHEYERQLEESEQRYRTLVEQFPNGIVTLFDDDLRYTLAEGQAFESLPVDRDELEGRTPREVWGDDVADALEPALRAAIDGEAEAVELSYIGREWVVHAVPIADESGDVFAGMTMAQDVTERREYERQLEESERRYRTLAEHFPNGAVGVYDRDLRYTLTEGRVLGETLPGSEALEGDRVPEIFPEETVADLEPLFRAAVEDGETGSVRTEFGGRHWRVWATPLRDGDGEIFAGLSFTQDITERVERQRQLEESNERLEQFAYAASHDLQEPLRMVSSYLRLLERRHGDDLDADGEAFLEFAVDGADRMREMIEALLEYSRVETGGDPLEPVELDAVLDDVLADLRLRIEETDAEVTTEPLPRVEGDPSQLRQLFQNLLDNALTYSGDDPPRVEVSAERTGREWVISVTDEGVGIDPDEVGEIFEVFRRLHGRDEHAGTGIGLALCRRIVERHGGEIWVDSEPGDGSAFSFALPAASARDGDE